MYRTNSELLDNIAVAEVLHAKYEIANNTRYGESSVKKIAQHLDLSTTAIWCILKRQFILKFNKIFNTLPISNNSSIHSLNKIIYPFPFLEFYLINKQLPRQINTNKIILCSTKYEFKLATLNH